MLQENDFIDNKGWQNSPMTALNLNNLKTESRIAKPNTFVHI